jgi:hypothetical protein
MVSTIETAEDLVGIEFFSHLIVAADLCNILVFRFLGCDDIDCN